MKRKLISTLACLTIFVGLGTTAFAQGLPNVSVTQKTVTASPIDAKSHTTHKIKVGDNYKFIKSQLENGATVSSIKSKLEANFKSHLEKEVSIKKINADTSNDLFQSYKDHLEKKDILDGVVTNDFMKKSLNSGKTLGESKESLLSKKTSEINKLISEHKISATRGKNDISHISKNLSKNKDIFLNEGLVYKIRKDINAGESISTIKENMINSKIAKTNEKVKGKNLTQSQIAKIDAHIKKEIDNLPEFKHLSNIHWVQEALNKGENISSIKTQFSTKINSLISKESANKKLSASQIAKRKATLTKINERIQTKGIFSVNHI